MADYILNSQWSDIDAVASAYKAGALVEKRKLYNPTERDILPISAKPDGSLWSRSSMVYSFESMDEYDDFTNENQEKIKNGDHVWIKSSNINGATKNTLYLYYQQGLNMAVEIVSGVTTGSGGESGGYVPPEGGIPTDHLSEDVQKKLLPQDGFGFQSQMAYNDFIEKYPNTLKDKDFVWITGANSYVLYYYWHGSLQKIYSIPIASGAVIWYTNVNPNNGYFVLSDLNGPAGSVPSPGHMIVSNYSGNAYFITTVNEDVATIANYYVQLKGDSGPQGSPGHTPQKGVDYWTEADQESIVQQVITALGTPVFGTVDTQNNIILSGNLADGKYTVKYENADGEQTVIGTLNHTVVPKPSYTNQIPISTDADGSVFNGTGYKANTRISSIGIPTEDGQASGWYTTGLIPIVDGDTIRSSDGMFDKTNTSGTQRIAFYRSDKSFITEMKLTPTTLGGAYANIFSVSDLGALLFNLNVSEIWGSSFNGTVAYCRICAKHIDNNSIVTINEEIV